MAAPREQANVFLTTSRLKFSAGRAVRDRSMNKYERRMWFERLLELRDQYRRAAETLAVISIDEAIALVVALDGAPEAETSPSSLQSPRRMCP